MPICEAKYAKYVRKLIYNLFCESVTQGCNHVILMWELIVPFYLPDSTSNTSDIDLCIFFEHLLIIYTWQLEYFQCHVTKLIQVNVTSCTLHLYSMLLLLSHLIVIQFFKFPLPLWNFHVQVSKLMYVQSVYRNSRRKDN